VRRADVAVPDGAVAPDSRAVASARPAAPAVGAGGVARAARRLRPVHSDLRVVPAAGQAPQARFNPAARVAELLSGTLGS